MSIESVMPFTHLILCHLLLLLPSIVSSIRVFSNESVFRIRRPEYWSFSFSISPSVEYSGLISFRIVWFDLLTAQGTLKSLLQNIQWAPYKFFQLFPAVPSTTLNGKLEGFPCLLFQVSVFQTSEHLPTPGYSLTLPVFPYQSYSSLLMPLKS